MPILGTLFGGWCPACLDVDQDNSGSQRRGIATQTPNIVLRLAWVCICSEAADAVIYGRVPKGALSLGK